MESILWEGVKNLIQQKYKNDSFLISAELKNDTYIINFDVIEEPPVIKNEYNFFTGAELYRMFAGKEYIPITTKDCYQYYKVIPEIIVKCKMIIIPFKLFKFLRHSTYEKSMIIPFKHYSYYMNNHIPRVIGTGIYGKVYSYGKHAIKFFHIDKRTNDKYANSTFLREVSILSRCNHQHVVKLIDVNIDFKKNLIIVMELAEWDLYEYMKNYDPLPLHVAKNFTYQILLGFEYLHSRNILHGDIKSNNILLYTNDDDDTYILKISDFGLSMSVPTNIKYGLITECYTDLFRPPEIFFKHKYNLSADVWAIGCLIYYIYTGQYLFSSSKITGPLDVKTVSHMISLLGDPYPYFKGLEYNQLYLDAKSIVNSTDLTNLYPVSDGYIWANIIVKMINYDQNFRVKISDVVTLDYFKDQPEYKNLSQAICKKSLHYREQYQVIQPRLNIDNTIRIKYIDIIREFSINLKYGVFVYAVYIFDAAVNSIITHEDDLYMFSIACVKIAMTYKTDIFFTFSEDETDYINFYVEMILKTISIDLLITTCYDFLIDSNCSSCSNLKLLDKVIMSGDVFKNLPSEIANNIIIESSNNKKSMIDSD